MSSGPCRPSQLIGTLQPPQDLLPVLNHTSHWASLASVQYSFYAKWPFPLPLSPNVCSLYLKIQLHPSSSPPKADNQTAFSGRQVPRCFRPSLVTAQSPNTLHFRPLRTASFYKLFAAQKCRLRLFFKPRYLNESRAAPRAGLPVPGPRPCQAGPGSACACAGRRPRRRIEPETVRSLGRQRGQLPRPGSPPHCSNTDSKPGPQQVAPGLPALAGHRSACRKARRGSCCKALTTEPSTKVRPAAAPAPASNIWVCEAERGGRRPVFVRIRPRPLVGGL